jgi:hypothetical protein
MESPRGIILTVPLGLGEGEGEGDGEGDGDCEGDCEGEGLLTLVLNFAAIIITSAMFIAPSLLRSYDSTYLESLVLC